MSIDKCPHSFAKLATTVLPELMSDLRKALQTPHAASLFIEPRLGRAGVLRRLGLAEDFSGCYVLVGSQGPSYVGISRGVVSRLRQHFNGKTHFDASLVYKMAQRRRPTPGRRSEVMDSEIFKPEFQAAQAELRSSQVAFIPIKNPLELYLFEVYAAMELATHEWNSFRTH